MEACLKDVASNQENYAIADGGHQIINNSSLIS